MIGSLALAIALVVPTLRGEEAARQATAAPAPPSAPPSAPSVVAIEPRAGSGVVSFTSELAPGERFDFVTCEALVIAGVQVSELYPIKLEPKDWKQDGASWSYSWAFAAEKIRLDLRATPEMESCKLEYRLTNESEAKLAEVLLYPCLPTMGAASIYPGSQDEAKPGPEGRKARAGKRDFDELYGRLHLWSEGQRFAFKDAALAATEKHIAFMKRGENPIEFAWFVNDERTFDVPLLAAASKDGKSVVGFALDSTVQASSNVGDGRACIHLVPFFRELEAGKSATTTARFYWMRGGPDDLFARYERDFAAGK